MAKALQLGDQILAEEPPMPRAAQRGKPVKAAPKTWLQIRLREHEAEEIKIAAIKAKLTISDYMLACERAYREK
jgi:hypothetical protein